MDSFFALPACWVFSGAVTSLSAIFELVFGTMGLIHHKNDLPCDKKLYTWLLVYGILLYISIFVNIVETIIVIKTSELQDSFHFLYPSHFLKLGLLVMSIVGLYYVGSDFDENKECDGFGTMIIFSASTVSLISATFIFVAKTIIYYLTMKLRESPRTELFFEPILQPILQRISGDP
jgi:hypothetical protein